MKAFLARTPAEQPMRTYFVRSAASQILEDTAEHRLAEVPPEAEESEFVTE